MKRLVFANWKVHALIVDAVLSSVRSSEHLRAAASMFVNVSLIKFKVSFEALLWASTISILFFQITIPCLQENVLVVHYHYLDGMESFW